MSATGNMKVADVLSDLTSLQVCDSSAALALVSARSSGDAASNTILPSKDDNDTDLKRAKDLLALHATVKMAHQDGTDHDLNGARDDVARVMRSV